MPRFRFGLKIILLLMVPLGAVAYWAAPWINDRPIDWVDFSEDRLNQELDDGKTVVVFAGADWDITAAVIRKASFGRKARRWINRKSIVSMSIDTSSFLVTDHEQVHEIMAPQHNGKFSSIYLSLFSPSSREHPIVLASYFTEGELIAAFKELSIKQSKR